MSGQTAPAETVEALVEDRAEKSLQSRAYSFALAVIRLVDKREHRDLSSEVIAKQLLRSATSIGANIEEAQAGTSRRDFTNFFFHALKSANETKYWLGLLKDAGKADSQTADVLLREAGELARILGASVLTLRSRR